MKKHLYIAAALALMSASGFAAGSSPQILVKKGDADPARPGITFDTFQLPSFNNANQIAFVGEANNGSFQQDLFRATLGNPNLTVIATQGGTAPGGTFSRLNTTNPPLINLSGQIAFTDSNSDGIYRADGISADTLALAADGAASPDGIGVLSFTFPVAFSFNDQGQAGFTTGLSGSSVTSANNQGAFRADATGIKLLARAGDVSPNGVGTLTALGAVSLNASGTGAFSAGIAGTSSSSDAGVFTSNGTLRTQIARYGDVVPATGGTFIGFLQADPFINASGQVAFVATLSKDTRTGVSPSTAIYRNTSGVNLEIAHIGQALPGGVTYSGLTGIDGFGSPLIMNSAGQVCTLINSDSSPNKGAGGILRGDGITQTLIAHIGEATPRGDGSVMSSFASSAYAMNNKGDVAFTAALNSGQSKGLFLYSDTLGLNEIAEYGDSLDGSTITGLDFAGATAATDEPSATGLTDSDQITFRYDLANGSEGIAVWQLPEPATPALLLILGSVIILHRRRGLGTSA